MSFKSLGLSPELVKAAKSNGFESPYPIQKEAIIPIRKGHDVLGIAQTGSGKTAAFALPLLMEMAKKQFFKNRHPKVLVLVPTRELAVQVQEVFYNLGNDLSPNCKSKAVYGGVSINPQMKNLIGVNILIATPGRLIELLENKAVFLSGVKTLVLDEADKILNLGFKDELDTILARVPKHRQNLLFSATLSPEVASMKKLLLNEPVVISAEEKESHVELINQRGYFVDEEFRGPLLRHIIKTENLQQVLVFTSSVHRADSVAKKLVANGIDARAIHSKKSQGARTDALTKFKNGKLRVLVATDLLSRGIDIEFLPVVVNYELPRSPKDFIHRIGRTGRAENPGTAITFVSRSETHHFKVILKKSKLWMDMVDAVDMDL